MVAFWYNQPGSLLRFKNYLFLFSFLVLPTNKSTAAHIIPSRINILLYKPSSSVRLCSIKILLAEAQRNPCAIEGITQGNLVILVQIQALRLYHAVLLRLFCYLLGVLAPFVSTIFGLGAFFISSPR